MRAWPLLLLAGCDRVLGLSPPPSPPDAQTCLTEPFTGDVLGPSWSVFSATAMAVSVQQHDQLEFHYVAGAPNGSYNNITSVRAYDFTRGYLLAELVQPPGLHRETSLRLGMSPMEYYDLDIRYNVATESVPRVYAKKGDTTQVFDRPYDPVNDRWFRVSIDGAVVTFETSPDGAHWNGQQSAVTIPTAALSVTIDAYVPGGALASDPAGAVYWDNLAMNAVDCAP